MRTNPFSSDCKYHVRVGVPDIPVSLNYKNNEAIITLDTNTQPITTHIETQNEPDNVPIITLSFIGYLQVNIGTSLKPHSVHKIANI